MNFVVLVVLAAVLGFTGAVPGNCSLYTQKSTNCAKGCGSCFNPGSRRGVLCPGQQTGYYCPPEPQGSGEGMAFACLDWTAGSAAMQAAQDAYNARSGFPAVFFGVGSYGTSSDPQRGLGACYNLTVAGVSRPLLVQSINTGSDVDGNQFDLMVGDGGAGAFDTCVGTNSPASMFPGTKAPWGNQYGGVDNRAQCAGLPPFPIVAAPAKAVGDNLISLCQYSFDNNFRMEGGGNPSIQSVARVACPAELVNITQLQRSDDPAAGLVTDVKTADGHVCDDSSGNLAWCLTRMMDCRKPSGAVKDNVQAALTVAGNRLVQPCTSDGYTRIDVQCGCFDCYC